jgi:hypothetical protein
MGVKIDIGTTGGGMRREKRGGRKPHVAEERPVEHVARPGAKVKASTRKETETRRRSRKAAQ